MSTAAPSHFVHRLGYGEVGVAMDRGFVLADEYGRTNVPGVWAVGDIVPGVQLAHRGFAQGIVVAEKIAGLDPTPVDDVLVPKVTFCEPEIASVGLSEAKAAEIHGKENITSAEFNVAGNAKSQILGTQGFVKLVSLKDGPILGFHAIGARMGEQVGEGQLMVSWEADADDVAALVHAHPTQNETLRAGARPRRGCAPLDQLVTIAPSAGENSRREDKISNSELGSPPQITMPARSINPMAVFRSSSVGNASKSLNVWVIIFNTVASVRFSRVSAST